MLFLGCFPCGVTVSSDSFSVVFPLDIVRSCGVGCLEKRVGTVGTRRIVCLQGRFAAIRGSSRWVVRVWRGVSWFFGLFIVGCGGVLRFFLRGISFGFIAFVWCGTS